jgi:hypothetical protein
MRLIYEFSVEEIAHDFCIGAEFLSPLGLAGVLPQFSEARRPNLGPYLKSAQSGTPVLNHRAQSPDRFNAYLTLSLHDLGFGGQ